MFDPWTARIGFIGAGRLAGSLAVGLCAAGYRVTAVASAGDEAARRLASVIGAGVSASTPHEVTKGCDLVFLTVPDSAIAAVAASVQWRAGQGVVHCSGALGIAALSAAATAGAMTGCFHPLQSFPSRDGDARRFHGVTCGVEAAGSLSAVLERMAVDLGGHAVRLEGIDRAKYHAAAVFASNYVVSLMAAAARSWEQAGLPPDTARSALTPLLLGASQNVAARDLSEALTGPIARGDTETVERHLAALTEPDLGELYRRLGAVLLTLDLGHSPETASRLRAILSEEGP